MCPGAAAYLGIHKIWTGKPVLRITFIIEISRWSFCDGQRRAEHGGGEGNPQLLGALKGEAPALWQQQESEPGHLLQQSSRPQLSCWEHEVGNGGLLGSEDFPNLGPVR